MNTFSDIFSNTAHGPRSYMRDSMVVLTALGAIILIIAIWANYYRKPPATRKRRERRSSSSSERSASPGTFSSDQELKPATAIHPVKSNRKRKRRREHRPRNPTLAESGGLPPVRPDGASPRGT